MSWLLRGGSQMGRGVCSQRLLNTPRVQNSTHSQTPKHLTSHRWRAPWPAFRGPLLSDRTEYRWVQVMEGPLLMCSREPVISR